MGNFDEGDASRTHLYNYGLGVSQDLPVLFPRKPASSERLNNHDGTQRLLVLLVLDIHAPFRLYFDGGLCTSLCGDEAAVVVVVRNTWRAHVVI